MVEEQVGSKRGKAKERVGTVVRAKMAKTVIVQVERLAQHSLYPKTIRKRKNYVAHDEKGVAKAGDRVRIVETRPISKTKHWRVAEVLKK